MYILIRVFCLNIEISTSRQDRIHNNVGGVSIKFNVKDLNRILGIKDEGLKICSCRKELMLNHFLYVNEIWNTTPNVYGDLSDDICHMPFPSQLLPL